MTFYTVMAIAKDKDIDIATTYIKVSSNVMHISGTSADLVEG